MQMHFPSGAWAEVYSCQPSSGLWKRVCRDVMGQRAGTQWGIRPTPAGREKETREMTGAFCWAPGMCQTTCRVPEAVDFTFFSRIPIFQTPPTKALRG